MFLMAGSMKLAAAPPMVALFDATGLPLSAIDPGDRR
jgi:hypothetical protein